MRDSLYLVMPAHNEGRVIGSVVARAKRKLPGALVIVINDGSEDNTAAEAISAGAHVITLPFNCGYGVALQTGLLFAYRAGAQMVVTLDADGQHEPDDVTTLMEPVIRGVADVVLGSRYLPQSHSYRVPAARRIPSFCMAKLLSLLSRQAFTDSTTGFQCLGRKALALLTSLKDFPEKTPDADLLLYLTMHGCRVREVPVTMHADAGGQSMHGVFKSLLYIPNMCTSMLGVVLGYVFSGKGGYGAH